MIPEFKNLNQEEMDVLINSPALITLLIAGADGKINEKEVDWGAKIAHFRALDEQSILQNYYLEVDKTFNEALKELSSKVPLDKDERISKINQELEKNNAIFKKLDSNFAKELYKSYLRLAKQVAKASGGIWGYGSISPEEQKQLDLHVINPVE